MSELNNRPVSSISVCVDTGIVLAKHMPSFTDSNGTHYMGYTESRISGQDVVDYSVSFTFSDVACGEQCHWVVWNGCDAFELSDEDVCTQTKTFHPFLCVEVAKPENFADDDFCANELGLIVINDGRFFKAI